MLGIYKWIKKVDSVGGRVGRVEVQRGRPVNGCQMVGAGKTESIHYA